MGYQAGNLELDILGFSTSAVTSIDNTAKALRRLALSVDKINNTQFVFAGQKIEHIFEKIAKATNSINTQNITNLAGAAKSLSAISRLSALDKMDFNKVGQGFQTLSVAIQPFLDKVKQAEASLVALEGVLRRSSGKKMQALLGGNTAQKGGGLFNLTKIGITTYMMRRLGRFMGELVQAGSDYNETLNLWQVAMRNNLDVADKFISKMQKAYGISSKTLMNAQAVFKNMIGSLGQVSDETAYALSEALVQMSADYASLYNRTLESAFQNMQSMLAGQVRPIRSAGLDMTETTLFMFYQQLGGTKTMRQLNRTEKQLLSILAVYKQMGKAGALGDMSKTLNQFANQSRMMVEYWTELKTWSGLLIKDLIDEWGILVKINALLITVTEIVKAFAKSRGLGEENYLTGMFETAEATNNEIDELQGKLLDFDKFRSLEGSTASPLAIDEKLIEAITGYSSRIDEAQNKAEKLAEEWLKILGFTKDTNGEWVTSKDNLEAIDTVIKSIGITLGIIAGLGIISSIVRFGIAIYTYGIIPLMSLVTVIGKFVFAIAKSAITAVVNFIQVLYAMNTIALGSSLKAIFTMTSGFIGLGAAITGAFLLISNWGNMSTWQRVLGVIGVVTTAVLGLAMAFGVFHSAWSMGAAAIGIAAGIGMIAASIATIKKDINSSGVAIDTNVMNTASTMGVSSSGYTPSYNSGNTSFAQQTKSATAQALKEWWSTAKHDIPQFQSVSESGIYTIVDGEARRRGKTLTKV